MSTFIAPASFQVVWSKGVPVKAEDIAVMESYAKAQKGIAHWTIEGVDTLYVLGDDPARVVPMKDGVVVAFGAATPKAAKWKARDGIAFPVTDTAMVVFSTTASEKRTAFELAVGTYTVVFDTGLVRLRAAKGPARA